MKKFNSDAFRAFMTNKPNPPEHAAYMARAAELFPNLPPGAQQNALHCLETLGKGYARRYAANAAARNTQNERHIMGTTLAAWRVKRADHAKPYTYEGVRRDTPKRAREEAERLARYHAHMAAGAKKLARQNAKARTKAMKANFPRMAAALSASLSANV